MYAGFLFAGYEPPKPWGAMVLPILAATAALAQLSRRLPAQNIVCIAGIILLFSGAMVACSAVSGVPFGEMDFTEKAQPKIFKNLPVWLPLWWVAILVTCRETARLVLQPYHKNRYYGFWMIGLAAVLAVIIDLGWEPFSVHVKNYWTRPSDEDTATWYSAPYGNFVGWIVTTVITLGFCSPWFMSKKPVRQPVHFHEAIVWGLIGAQFMVGNALESLWLAVVVCLVLSVLVLLLAWRGVTWKSASSARDHHLGSPTKTNTR